MIKKTTEQFIKEAKLIHGDEYDYSLVEYINNSTKIKIKCNSCGNIFEQLPRNHICLKQKCPFCYKSNKKTTEQFIQEAKLIHGDKYDYSLVEYANNSTKIKIKCKTCDNIFEQIPRNHIIKKYGCPICSKRLRKTTEQFIEKAKQIHGDKYDYSLVDYINSKTKVKIICPKHGMFEQNPDDHINGKKGCIICCGKNRRDTEQFIKEAKQIHGDKYDYSLVEYKGCRIKVKIICPKHGIFEQSFTEHVNRKQRCPKCYNSKGEEKIRKLLQDKKIKFEEQKKFSDLKDKKSLSYDFYIPSKNLLIECNGEQHYKFNKCFHKNLHEFHRQLHHDWLKRKYAKDNNINLLVIPYWMISGLS